jgi:hypothetical protein
VISWNLLESFFVERTQSEEHTSGAMPKGVGSDCGGDQRGQSIAVPQQGWHANRCFAGPAAELVCEVSGVCRKLAQESNRKNLSELSEMIGFRNESNL